MKQQREAVRTALNYVAQQVIVRERIEMLMCRHYVWGRLYARLQPLNNSARLKYFSKTLIQIGGFEKYACQHAWTIRVELHTARRDSPRGGIVRFGLQFLIFSCCFYLAWYI